MQGASDQGSGHISPNQPAHHVLGAGVLKRVQVNPGPGGQQKVSNITHPHPVGLDGARPVEQQVGRAALPMGLIGGARGKGLGLQGFPPVPTQSRTQGLLAHPVADFPQFDLESTRSVATFVPIKNGNHFRFPSRFVRPHGPDRQA